MADYCVAFAETTLLPQYLAIFEVKVSRNIRGKIKTFEEKYVILPSVFSAGAKAGVEPDLYFDLKGSTKGRKANVDESGHLERTRKDLDFMQSCAYNAIAFTIIIEL